MAKVALPEVLQYAADEAEKNGIDPSLAKAIVLAENYGDSSSGAVFAQPEKYNIDTERVSNKGARGIMQVMPATYEGLKKQGFLPQDHTLDTWQGHVQAGVAALKEIQKRIGSSDYEAIAADYNAGPRGSKAFFSGGKLPSETERYLNKVSMAVTGFEANKPGPVTQLVPSPPQTFGTAEDGPQPTSGMPVGEAGGSGDFSGGGTKTTTSSVQDYSAIESLVNRNGLILQEIIKNLTTSKEEEAAAHRQAATSLEQAGQAASLVEQQRAIIEAASAANKDKILQLVNLDPNNIDNLVASTLNQFRADDVKRKELANDIDQRQAVGFFDNPLQWLVNQTVLPGRVSAHNALARRQNEGMQVVQTMEVAAKNLQALDVAATADQIAGLHIALGNEKVAHANANAAVQKAQAASATARMASSIAQLTNTEIEQKMALARMRKIVETEGNNGKSKQQMEEEAEFEQQLKVIGTAIGAPDVSIASVKRQTKADQDAWANAVARKAAGTNMGDALLFIKKFGNYSTLAGTGSAEFAVMVRDLDNEVSRTARIAERQPDLVTGKKPTPEQQYRMAADDLYGKYWKEKVDLLSASPNNPYKLNHFAMVTGWTGDPNNEAYKYARSAYTNKVKVNDSQLFTAISQQVIEGKLNPSVAAQQLSDYYANGVALNNKGKTFSFVGMEAQGDYVILPKNSRLSINLVNPGDIENFFVRVRSEAVAGNGTDILLKMLRGAGDYLPSEAVKDAKNKQTPKREIVTAGSN